MGEMITKPDANPIVLAALNCIVCMLPLGYFMMGQSGKGIAGVIYVWLLSAITFGMLGWVVALAFAYDAYLLGQKLAAGESIGEKENGLAFLDNLPGFK
jgi:TM2 domain-containing membrane protein YozV